MEGAAHARERGTEEDSEKIINPKWVQNHRHWMSC